MSKIVDNENREAKQRTSSGFNNSLRKQALTSHLVQLGKETGLSKRAIFLKIINEKFPEFFESIYIPDEDFAIYTQVVNSLGYDKAQKLIVSEFKKIYNEAMNETI
jgi:DNA polymerase elongation subunit (family B)